MRADAPVFVPLPAAVAAGDETSPDEEVLALQQPQSQPQEEEASPDEEVLVSEQQMPMLNISEPLPSQDEDDYYPSENEGEGPPRIQPSEVPEEFQVDLGDVEECEPSQGKHIFQRLRPLRKQKVLMIRAARRKTKKYLVRQGPTKKQRPRRL